MDYEKLALTNKPHTIKTLLIGEAPPPNGKSYFYKVPEKYPTRKSSIEDDTSLPATIFNHYFGRRPEDPQEYEQFLKCLKERGIFLVDILNKPIVIRKKDGSIDEGNLKILYRDDYKKFVYYNAVDSILVQKIHEKMKYIDILYGISTLSKIKVLDAFSTLPVTEGIIREKLKDIKNIVLCKLDDQDGYIDPSIPQSTSPSVKGGWVKIPFRGMKTWVCC